MTTVLFWRCSYHYEALEIHAVQYGSTSVCYSCFKLKGMAVPSLRRLVEGLSSCRPGFALWSVPVRFSAVKVVLGQVFLSSPVSIIPPWIHTHIPSRVWAIGPLEAAVQRDSLISLTRTGWMRWEKNTIQKTEEGKGMRRIKKRKKWGVEWRYEINYFSLNSNGPFSQVYSITRSIYI
jgi:hypothetical protein